MNTCTTTHSTPSSNPEDTNRAGARAVSDDHIVRSDRPQCRIAGILFDDGRAVVGWCIGWSAITRPALLVSLMNLCYFVHASVPTGAPAQQLSILIKRKHHSVQILNSLGPVAYTKGGKKGANRSPLMGRNICAWEVTAWVMSSLPLIRPFLSQLVTKYS